jgi:hypothetical protein
MAQSVLSADGKTDTYDLINSVLAPGHDAIESPDCSHPSFGPHITQAWDDDLAKPVFVFHIHVTPDNDRCSKFDRQRNEIKTYGPSPDYLKGFLGDSVTFRWKFKLDVGFQPSYSFTHIHQIKAGDGDDGAPIITLTPRYGSPEQLQLIHVDSLGKSTTVAQTDLAPFKGTWVEAYEKITYGFNGTYSIVIRRISDQAVLFSYSNSNFDMWRNGTTFVRPKWGIYRSLNHPEQLRDEQVRFDRFCLAKGTDDCASEPRDAMQSVFTDFGTALQSSSTVQDKLLLNQAQRHVANALNPSFWIDRVHLQPNGSSVFSEGMIVAELLRALVFSPKSSVPDADLQELIHRIVIADRTLAATAISEAAASGVSSSDIDIANSEFARGDQDIANGIVAGGLEHYRNAWEHAVRKED